MSNYKDPEKLYEGIAELIVEGTNDIHVVRALRKYHDMKVNFQVKTASENDDGVTGKDALLEGIPNRLRGSKFQTLGIILDADSSLEESWHSIRDKLTVYGYKSVPTKPNCEGTIIEEANLPRVGVWLMPNNQQPGILEDFTAHLIPEEDKLFPYAENVLSEIERDNLNRYRDVAKPKALIHTWLAWQKTPGHPLGLAITARSLRADSPLALQFVEWLNRLFNP